MLREQQRRCSREGEGRESREEGGGRREEAEKIRASAR